MEPVYDDGLRYGGELTREQRRKQQLALHQIAGDFEKHSGGIRQVGPSQHLVGYYCMNTSWYLMPVLKYFSKANIMIQGYHARLN